MSNYSRQPEELKNQLPVEILKRIQVIDSSINELERNPVVKEAFKAPDINMASNAETTTIESKNHLSSSELNAVRSSVEDAYEAAEYFGNESVEEAA